METLGAAAFVGAALFTAEELLVDVDEAAEVAGVAL